MNSKSPSSESIKFIMRVVVDESYHVEPILFFLNVSLPLFKVLQYWDHWWELEQQNNDEIDCANCRVNVPAMNDSLVRFWMNHIACHMPEKKKEW